MLPFDIPADLLALIKTARLAEDLVGRSTTRVYRVAGIRGGKGETNAYLKIGLSRGDDPLTREKAVLEWLEGKLPVPKVLYFGQQDGLDYLLISEIPGLNAAHRAWRESHHMARQMVKLLAEGLRMIHAVDITRCPFDRRLDLALSEALIRIKNGTVDSDDFQPENRGRKPEDIYRQLSETRPLAEDLVFTHGDYCLPNVILKDDHVSGFVDLGRAGIADRYQDLALAVRSLKYNLGAGELVELFLREYGLREIAADKIEFYILLDELF